MSPSFTCTSHLNIIPRRLVCQGAVLLFISTQPLLNATPLSCNVKRDPHLCLGVDTLRKCAGKRHSAGPLHICRGHLCNNLTCLLQLHSDHQRLTCSGLASTLIEEEPVDAKRIGVVHPPSAVHSHWTAPWAHKLAFSVRYCI